MEKVSKILQFIDENIAFGPHLIISLLALSVYLSFKTGFIQIKGLKKGFKLLLKNEGSGGGVSRFSALCTSLAATIGTGNIVGVATAISLGGPGALLWMLIAAFFGMATSYAEGLLAVKYRLHKNGNYIGGPFYYIERGLGKKFKFLAVVFSFCAVMAGTFGIGTIIQSNSIASAVAGYFKNATISDSFNYAVAIVGAIVTLFAALVLIGGINRISKVSEIFVPFMSAVYIVISLTIIITNIEKLPRAITLIFTSAFNPKAVLGATSGITFLKAIKLGTSRGIFSNEAGLGSGAIAAASANGTEAVEQGLVSMLGPFIDTIVLCTITGLGHVITGAYTTSTNGADITAYSWKNGLPISDSACEFLLMLLIIFFAFSSIIGWHYYTEKSLCYLAGNNKKITNIHRIIYVLAVFVAPYIPTSAVWAVADIFNAFMALPNLLALLLLSGVTANATKSYFNRRL